MGRSSGLILLLCCAFIGHIGSGQEVEDNQWTVYSDRSTDQYVDAFNRAVRVVSSWFEDEDMMSCVSCDDQADPTKINAISSLWLKLEDVVVHLPQTLDSSRSRKEPEKCVLAWVWTFLQFSFLSFLTVSGIVRLIAAHSQWTRRLTEDNFHDAESSDITIIEVGLPRFFPNLPEVMSQLSEIKENSKSEDDNKDYTNEIDVLGKCDSSKDLSHKQIAVSRSVGSGTCMKLSLLKPMRPAPPTVKVYNLHKPQEIPNDIMEALLCLKKNCEHDHAKIRLIGPKVFVYSTTRRQRVAKAKKRMKQAFEFRQPWLPGEARKVIGKDVLSDDFELEWETSTVSTQTERQELPYKLAITTGSNGSRQPGNFFFSADNLWDDSQSSSEELDERYSTMVCPSVRDSVIRSRPDWSQIELTLNDFEFEFGLPQANSSFHEDVSLRLARAIGSSSPRSDDISRNTGLDSCDVDQSTSLHFETTCTFAGVTDTDIGSAHTSIQNRVRSMISNKVIDLIPYRPSFISGDTILMDVSKNMTYMGSQTSFYERLSLLLVDCAMKKIKRTSLNLSWVYPGQSRHPAKHRFNRTV